MTTRREFLAWTGKIAIGGMAGLAVLEACEPTSFPSAASNSVTPPPPGPDGRIGIDVSDLTSSNPAKMAPGLTGPDGMPVMVTFTGGTSYYAMSMLCTHAACEINSKASNGVIPCACHGSQYDLSGKVVQGPATANLHQYDGVYDAANKQLRIKLV